MPLMRHLFKKFVAVLTLVAITSSFAWATSPEVFFDGTESEQLVAQLHDQDDASAVNADRHGHSQQGQPCNHGCHLGAHLLGVFPMESLDALIPWTQLSYSAGDADQVTSPFLKGLYRPPLATPLA